MLDRTNKSLRRFGFALHWLHERDKNPIGKGWSSKPVATLAALERTYKDGNNIGVRLGEWSLTEKG